MPQGEVVFDTTCVFYMTVTGHEDLLAERYGGRCYLPDEVCAEIRRGEVEFGYDCRGLLEASWWRPLAVAEPEDQRLFFEILRRWGKQERNHGEAAAIVLARSLGCTAVLDDLNARKAAQHLGVPITGTVGILARIAAEGRLSQVEAWAIHEEMVRLGFRSLVRTYEEFSQIVAALRQE